MDGRYDPGAYTNQYHDDWRGQRCNRAMVDPRRAGEHLFPLNMSSNCVVCSYVAISLAFASTEA